MSDPAGARPSWQAVAIARLLRRSLKPLLARSHGVKRVRALLGARHFSPARGLHVRADVWGGVPGEWVEPPAAPDAPVLLYLHGGGYVACSPQSHRPITMGFARRGLRVFAPDYRLAPEAPFPAALHDALAVYRALRRDLSPGTPIVVAGDSAGGGLALSLLLALRDAGDALPTAAVLFSPLTDFAYESGSRHTNSERCAFFDRHSIARVRPWVLNGHDPCDPLASPVHGDFHGLPPMLIHVGRDETLLDDSTRLAERARMHGVDVSISTWAAVPHVWQIFAHLVPEARASLDAAAAFLLRCVHPAPDVDVLIVGSGFAGLCMAMRLRQAGRDDFLILEKADEIGGTWRDNTYPGCACDVPSYLYSLSFAPRDDWSRMYAEQPEIQQYLLEIVAEHDLRRSIRFDTTLTEARWDEAARLWRVSTSQGDAITARVLVSGTGGLSRPAIPSIPGLDTFRGEVMHSARWNHDYDFEGKRVAVVGTGASAVQLVPQIAPKTSRLALFQRTPPWVLRRFDRPFTQRERARLRGSRLRRWLLRQSIYWLQETLAVGFTLWPSLMRPIERLALRHMARQVPDPSLRRVLTPDYRIGCKRILTSNDWYPALSRPNVEVVTDAIAEVTSDAVVTHDGRARAVDAIVLATGFRPTDLLLPLRIHGLNGVDINEAWRQGQQAYQGVSVSGFPNFFMLVGPNTGLGHSSIVYMIEAQVDYVMKCLDRMRARGARWMVPRPAAQDCYNQWLQQRLQRTVWATGCKSWYLDAHGRNTTLWPSFTFAYRARLARVRDGDHHFG